MTTAIVIAPTNPELIGRFEAAAERVRAWPERLIPAAKQTGQAALDCYQKALAGLVEFEQQVAGTSPIDWITTIVKAQATLLAEINAGYTAVARKALQ